LNPQGIDNFSECHKTQGIEYLENEFKWKTFIDIQSLNYFVSKILAEIDCIEMLTDIDLTQLSYQSVNSLPKMLNLIIFL
jgi:hypothetical protein